MTAMDVHGETHEALAFNEVSIFRQGRQIAHVRISVGGQVRIPRLMCDGVLVATPAGSTAYNLSAQGPVLPLNAGLLAMTPISPFRPRGWRGALLPCRLPIRFECQDPHKRPMSAAADSRSEVRDATVVDIVQDDEQSIDVLCDPEFSLAERIFNEQFPAL